jgi:hypothetical protein
MRYSCGSWHNFYVEVIEGLQQGDRAITSSYSQMANMEQVQLGQ